jgi:DNA-binding PadR family transcriptional regulator
VNDQSDHETSDATNGTENGSAKSCEATDDVAVELTTRRHCITLDRYRRSKQALTGANRLLTRGWRYLDNLGVAHGQLDLLLLAVLRRGGPQHGYAVIAGLRQASDGEFDLPEGTVYPALHKLERDGFVQSEWSIADGRKRRVYSLTGMGRAALSAKKKEWTTFRRGVEAVLT